MAELDLFIPMMLAGDALRAHGHEMTPQGVMQVTLQATDDPTQAELAAEEALRRELEKKAAAHG